MYVVILNTKTQYQTQQNNEIKSKHPLPLLSFQLHHQLSVVNCDPNPNIHNILVRVPVPT